MRIVITVEEDQTSPSATVSSVDAVSVDHVPASPSESDLTKGATSAGSAADPPDSAEPPFIAQSAVATSPPTDHSQDSEDISAGQAPDQVQ